jgi:hypothetical protein
MEVESVKEIGPADQTAAPILADPEGAPATARPGAPGPTPARGALVSLRMELAVYFRRETTEAAPAPSTEAQ